MATSMEVPFYEAKFRCRSIRPVPCKYWTQHTASNQSQFELISHIPLISHLKLYSTITVSLDLKISLVTAKGPS